uniref:Uncharacterized protein n=1 Tax=Glossina austeni TaxID=7395 RepID=A0A1A9VXL1_GLOAU
MTVMSNPSQEGVYYKLSNSALNHPNLSFEHLSAREAFMTYTQTCLLILKLYYFNFPGILTRPTDSLVCEQKGVNSTFISFTINTAARFSHISYVVSEKVKQEILATIV